MTTSVSRYIAACQDLPGAVQSQMFGKPCFKINGKAFASFFDECMVFKLDKEEREEALMLSGARHFDPSGRNRPMKEWVQLPLEHAERWPELAGAALKYVSSLK